MDPITVIVLLMVVLASGGLGGAAWQRRSDRQIQLDMREAIRSRQTVDGQLDVSVFDVFWDLGATEWSLEIMASQRLLLEDAGDAHVVLEALRDELDAHGSYAAFIRENLEAIQEFHRAHRKTGNRRALPALTSKPRKSLRLTAVDASSGPSATQTMPVPYTGRFAPVAPVPGDQSLRSRNHLVLATPQDSGVEIDLDEVTRIEPIRMLKGIFSGSSMELERWWELRDLRLLRESLDEELRQLYRRYAGMARSRTDFYTHLFDTADRWASEAERIDLVLKAQPFSGRPGSDCAQALLKEAAAVSRQLSYRSRSNVEETIELIHSHARRGDTAMAGYLIYLNRHAFFAGSTETVADILRRVETRTYKIQSELRSLNQRRVI